MKIKRFFAKDMRTALLQVKEELGSEAVIMSNKKVTGGVEIVAAVDGDGQHASSAPASSDRFEAAEQASGLTPSSYSKAKPSAAKSAKKASHVAKPMSKRFANMLKQYTTRQDETDHGSQVSDPDSLSALLQRQSQHSNSSHDDVSVTLSKHSKHSKHVNPLANSSLSLQQIEPGLQRLISEDQRVEKPQPKLDPTRYERLRSATAEHKSTDQELDAMLDEIVSIRYLLEHQVSGLMWQEVERKEPLRAMLIKRLQRMGMSAEFAEQMACYIPEDTEPARAWTALLALIGDQISLVKKDIIKRGGIVALLGPTGVGKTTTVAKLAARAVMEYGADNVALVTTDSYRIGAREQLSIYGRIMGCPVRSAKDSEELADTLYQLRHRRLILIDTAGMGQRDIRLTEQLDTLMQKTNAEIHSYLVLPATAQRGVLQETIDHFKRIPLSGCIMTKLDEALSLGEFMSVIIQNMLPIAYIANGQRVPEDIITAQANFITTKADELLDKSTHDEPHYWNRNAESY